MRLYFYRGRGLLAALVRWFTRSKYAHVSVVFDDGVVYEATVKRGVMKGQLKSVDGVTPFVFHTNAPMRVEAARIFCESELGVPYNYWAIFGFVFGLKPRYSEIHWTCSEFAACACQRAGVFLQERVEPFKLSPDNLSWSPWLEIDHARKFQWDHAGRYL